MVIFARSADFGYFSVGDEKSAFVLGPYSKDVEREKIVNDIHSKWLNNPGNIDCLYLVAHGNSGVLWLGKPGIGITGAALFAKLQGAFTPGGRGIEIHGCACASSTEITNWHTRGTASNEGAGYNFLWTLAKNSGVKVTAPVDGVSGFSAAYSYKGVRTMTVYPSGSSYFENYGD